MGWDRIITMLQCELLLLYSYMCNHITYYKYEHTEALCSISLLELNDSIIVDACESLNLNSSWIGPTQHKVAAVLFAFLNHDFEHIILQWDKWNWKPYKYNLSSTLFEQFYSTLGALLFFALRPESIFDQRSFVLSEWHHQCSLYRAPLPASRVCKNFTTKKLTWSVKLFP